MINKICPPSKAGNGNKLMKPTFIEIYLNDGKDTMTLRAFPENVEINLI